MDFRTIKILVATNSLESVGGSETYTYALIEELNKRKYDIEYFTINKGLISDKIENLLGVSYMSKKKYDLILANHNTIVEHLFGKGFIIQTCHGIYPELEQPSYKADAFVAISQEVQDHLAHKGLPSKIILNGINLERFSITKPVSKKLSTVLSLCHSKEANEMVKAVCLEKGLKYIQAFKYQDPIWDVENVINKADLVIGLGRSAYEAMACGRPVIIFDKRNYFEAFGDGYIANVLGFSTIKNCSGRYFKIPFKREHLENELRKYNAEHSLFFRNFAERELDIRRAVDLYFYYYSGLLKNEKFIKKNLLINLAKRTVGRTYGEDFLKLRLYLKKLIYV